MQIAYEVHHVLRESKSGDLNKFKIKWGNSERTNQTDSSSSSNGRGDSDEAKVIRSKAIVGSIFGIKIPK